MSRVTRLQDFATDAALESKCRIKHGALITQGNRVIASGCNNTRTRFLGKLDICQHAEMDVLTKVVNNVLRRVPEHKKQRKIDNLVVWSVRVSEGKQTFSLPCKVCLYRLKEFGFKKLAYSTHCGNIEILALRDVSNEHTSLIQQTYSEFIRW